MARVVLPGRQTVGRCSLPNSWRVLRTQDWFWFLIFFPFEISITEGSAPVTFPFHHINIILVKQANATLNQYLAVGLIQHSISSYLSPHVVIPKQSWWRLDRPELQEPQPNRQPQSTFYSRRGPDPSFLGQGRLFSLFVGSSISPRSISYSGTARAALTIALIFCPG